MRKIWGPSLIGKIFTAAPNWYLVLTDTHFEISIDGDGVTGDVDELSDLRVEAGTFWSTVSTWRKENGLIILGGIPNREAKDLRAVIGRIVRKRKVQKLLSTFSERLKSIQNWADEFSQACSTQLQTKGWLTQEFQERQCAARPQLDVTLLAEPEIKQFIHVQEESVKKLISMWAGDLKAHMAVLNVSHTDRELRDSRPFFDYVEKTPLTEEQARAVICFDNRVLLIASAGSGKTSTMVAKAIYGLKKGYVSPDKVLLLAFNDGAVKELGARVSARLKSIGFPEVGLAAKTFHSFGSEIIGEVTGRKPRVAPWVGAGLEAEITLMLELIDELRDQDLQFRYTWDLFRIVLGQELPAFGKEEELADAWDKENEREGFWTLNNEVVRSRGEVLIANWLFYNGVQYQYERPYEVDTATPTHRQYCPDFFLPEANAYLEHWALDTYGNPPASFEGYKEDMVWKRGLHAKHGTMLLETTMAGLWSGEAFLYLSQKLPTLGINLDPNPDRDIPGRKPIENRRLLATFRSFLTHAKSNRADLQVLNRRLDAQAAGVFGYRHKVFLSLFEKIQDKWEARLKAEKCIDFDDMLNSAADYLEAGKWNNPYELIMVDEFQDTSQARNRLIKALTQGEGKCLFAVGDDWQSIYRFAGSDLSAMTGFDEFFGKATTLRLETTFRCPQSLCDISSRFIERNPKQIKKIVRSAIDDVEEPIRIWQLEEESIASAIADYVGEIAQRVMSGEKPSRVYILGRYNRDKKYLPSNYDAARVDVKFLTIHTAKGLEADHVILPRVTSETLGFPSRMEDDPVLQLVMPGGDTYPQSEERRLFYVALTRARSSVTLITLPNKESPFILELVKDFKLDMTTANGSALQPNSLCKKCERGFMVERNGPHGPFWGCNRFPRCKHRQKPSPTNARH